MTIIETEIGGHRVTIKRNALGRHSCDVERLGVRTQTLFGGKPVVPPVESLEHSAFRLMANNWSGWSPRYASYRSAKSAMSAALAYINKINQRAARIALEDFNRDEL